MEKKQKIPHNQIVNEKMLSSFEKTLQILILSLIFALIIAFVKSLYILFFEIILVGGSVSLIIHEILYILILVELYTVLGSYLMKGYVKVERVVEVGIIALIRSTVIDFSALDTSKIYPLVALLIALGVIFFIEKYFSHQRNL